jgi:hypothetical protein
MSFLMARASQVSPTPAYDDCADNDYTNEAEFDEDDKNDEDNEDNDKQKLPYELFVEKKIEINNEKL